MPKRSWRDSSYKDYPEEVVHTLNAIRKYKELGFTLEEIRELLVLRSIQVLDLTKLLQVIELKISGVDAEIEKLHDIKLRLNREHRLLLRKQTGHIITLPEMKIAA